MAEPQTIDVTGLPESVVVSLRRLVDELRVSVAVKLPSVLTPEQRVAAWKEWIADHRDIRAIADDSRDSIYEGR
jgi:hypothetical protein